ncbi:MAG: DUF481 domain-containing protein [Gammaproteobacteria bacterium]|nr:DUF481 domain-containing protein [Gammaproteobacteria bacterium]
MNLKNSMSLLSVIGLMTLMPVVQAQETTEPVADALFLGWSGTASLGATTSTGNAETSNINGSIRLGKTVGKWEHITFASVFKGESALIVEQVDENGDTILDTDGRPQREIIRGSSSDRLALGYQPRYYWRERTYLFGVLDWERDKPAGIKSVTRQIIGIGHKFITTDNSYLSAEIGFGNKTTDQTFGDDINGGIGYLGVNYLNRVTDNVTFNADMRSDFGSDNTFVELGLGINFKVSSKIAFGVSHFSRSNSDISAFDDEFSSSSDSVTSLNLVVDI